MIHTKEDKLEIITWPELMKNIAILANQLPNNSRLWGIARGGLIIESLLSYQNPTFIIVHNYMDAEIIVDDICDTGNTIKKWNKYNYDIASVYVRYNCNPKPKFYVELVNHNKWLHFPYET